MQKGEEDQDRNDIDEGIPSFVEEPSAVAKAQQKYGKPSSIGQLVSEEELNSYEPGIRLKIHELLDARASAVEKDDFDVLVSLRDGILFLKEKGKDLNQYREMKKQAVENEDYEVAKRIKLLIEAEDKQIGQGYGLDSRTGKRFERSEKYRDIVVDVQRAHAPPTQGHPLDQLAERVGQNQASFPAAKMHQNQLS